MELIDLFKELGVFVSNCYSRKWRRNILGVRLYLSLKVDGITYEVPVKEIKCNAGEFDNLVSITLKGESNN